MKRLFGEYLTSVLLSQHTEQEAGGLGRFPNGTPFLDLIPSMRTPRLERAVAINSDGNKLIKKLRETDEFKNKYMESIYRIEHLIKCQWATHNSTEDLSLRSNCFDRIHIYTVTIHKLYDFLPTFCAIRPFEDAIKVMENQSKYGYIGNR